jgi:hypothetical protein
VRYQKELLAVAGRGRASLLPVSGAQRSVTHARDLQTLRGFRKNLQDCLTDARGKKSKEMRVQEQVLGRWREKQVCQRMLTDSQTG